MGDSSGTLNEDGSWTEKTVCWWHMADGAVLGVHDGMIIEYDASTLAPLGMVVSKDELAGRKAAVIDSGIKVDSGVYCADGAECAPVEQALVLYSENSDEVTVIQPNEDGSYWRKIVRNKMHRMKEQRPEGAEVKALSSFGPYTSTIGQVYKKNDLSLPAISTRPMDSSIKL